MYGIRVNTIMPSEKQFQLLALCAHEKSGRELAKAYEKEAGRKISYGTLYTTMRRLKEAGFVTVRDDEDADGRIRFFQATGAGLRAVAAARHRYMKLSNFGVAGGDA